MVINLINKASQISPRAVGILNIVISIIFDIAFSLFAFVFLYILRFEFTQVKEDLIALILDTSWLNEYRFQLHFGVSLFVVSILIMMLSRNGLYSTQRGVRYTRELISVIDASFWSLVFGILISFLFPELRRLIARTVLFGQVVLAIPFLFGWRFARRKVMERRYTLGFGRKNTLIIGAGRIGVQLHKWLENSPWLGLHVEGFLDDEQDPEEETQIIEHLSKFDEIAVAYDIRMVFITIPSQRKEVIAISEAAYRLNIEVKVVPEMFDLITREVAFETLGPFTVATLNRPTLTKGQALIKRIEDLAFCIPLLIFFLPISLLISIAIILDSPGPALFVQERIGEGGRVFSLIKFRSMFIDVDQEEHRKATLSLIQSKDNLDPRAIYEKVKKRKVTRVGRIIRRFSLDEVPQFLNVLKGEMSVVGPRPLLPYEYESYPDYYKKRILVKPGITGLWQISDRYNLAFEQMVLQDIRYINEWSIFLDIRIIFETIPLTLRGQGM